MAGQPYPRPAKRVKNPKAQPAAKFCEVCGTTSGLSRHHIYRKGMGGSGGDDVGANLMRLCGSGTTGCHGKVEARDGDTLRRVGEVIITRRGDVLDYLELKLGGEEQMRSFMLRIYLTEV